MPRSDRSVDERERDHASSSLVPTLVAVAGFFALLMIAAGLQGTPTFRFPKATASDRPQVSEPLPEQTSSGLPTVPPRDDSPVSAVIAIVLALVIAAAVLVMLFFAVRAVVRHLRALWRDRPLSRREAVDVVAAGPAAVVTGAPDPDTATIQRGISAALATIAGGVDAGDGIVAAWVGLEESAADAGVARGASETPAEFTVRILGRRDGIAAEITELLALYEGVRFGGRVADEADRAAAARCLRAIEEGWR